VEGLEKHEARISIICKITVSDLADLRYATLEVVQLFGSKPFAHAYAIPSRLGRLTANVALNLRLRVVLFCDNANRGGGGVEWIIQSCF